TGLANRQHWEWTVERELERAARGEGGAAMLMVDIDDFKDVNDRYGHILGDEVLTTVAHALRDSVRAGDVAGRYAGDEFALVMPGADEATARQVAECCRRKVASLRFPGAPALRCTVSIGLAVTSGRGVDAKHWINQADEAMYRSKRGGRNRVSVHAVPVHGSSAAILPLPLPRRAG
ncbi:MAG TPA: GGDEF domain-containing protein, partial [Candidatus Saccharimonadia bacterium]|nr:GGDEF domain-containing protein [Candidatus Saccharimonadia bacterium]